MCKVPVRRRGLSRFAFKMSTAGKTDGKNADHQSVETFFSSATCLDADETGSVSVAGFSSASDLSNVSCDLQSMQQLVDSNDFFDLRSASVGPIGSPLSLVKSTSVESDCESISLTDDGFTCVLDQALKPESALKPVILKRSALIYADETFRFYAAILEWERLVKEDQKSFRWNLWKKPETEAKRIVELFVDDAGRYANGCLSSATKSNLVTFANLKDERGCNLRFFEEAKGELRRDIWSNPSLKTIVLPLTGGAAIIIT